MGKAAFPIGKGRLWTVFRRPAAATAA